MTEEKEKRVLRYIWLDLECLKVWNVYLDLAHSNDKDREAKMEVLKKEIDDFEEKMVDISEGICYDDVVRVKKKHDIDSGSIILGVLLR